MAKRFTDTNKWDDPWYRRLSPANKHAWDYLCDKCDAAGVIELDREHAEFRIGAAVDWEAFFKISEHRVRILPSGKVWLTGFIAFQYGELKESNNLHRAVQGLLDKHQISLGAAQGLPRGCQAPDENSSGALVKEEVKEKEISGGGSEGETGAELPDSICGSKRLRAAVDQWLAYKRERREAYKPTGLRAFVSRVESVASTSGPTAVIAQIERAMASGWKGWEHGEARGSPAPARSSSHVHEDDQGVKAGGI